MLRVFGNRVYMSGMSLYHWGIHSAGRRRDTVTRFDVMFCFGRISMKPTPPDLYHTDSDSPYTRVLGNHMYMRRTCIPPTTSHNAGRRVPDQG
jgi:hypothetical protein